MVIFRGWSRLQCSLKWNQHSVMYRSGWRNLDSANLQWPMVTWKFQGQRGPVKPGSALFKKWCGDHNEHSVVVVAKRGRRMLEGCSSRHAIEMGVLAGSIPGTGLGPSNCPTSGADLGSLGELGCHWRWFQILYTDFCLSFVAQAPPWIARGNSSSNVFLIWKHIVIRKNEKQ